MSSFFQRLFRRPADTTPTPVSGDPYRTPGTPAVDPTEERERDRYRTVIDRTASMTRDGNARSLARRHNLDVLDLTWEDTGRYKGSAVGPNISDMTIQVSDALPGTAGKGAKRVTCMPVIRFPNFSDKTADISIDDVFLRVGNERGAKLRSISLREYLRDLRRYLSKPSSWAGSETSLLAPREKDVLVSAQACFLPVPKEGAAEFNPVLFNYQSYKGAPAVLTIVVTREGTSATIIDNTRDGFPTSSGRWGQRLFFNQNGERASFSAARMTEFVAAGGDETDQVSSMEAAKAAGLSCVMLIQVPLVQPERARASSMMLCAPMACAAPMAAPRSKRMAEERSDVDEAVIGHGAVEGPFTEIDNLAIKRDARFPIRVTVQFYKATSNGVVNADDVATLAAQIDSVYKDAKAVGSLVCEPDKGRSTEWDDEGNGKAQPADWWNNFWSTQTAATGKTREELLRDLEILLGRKPSQAELEDAIRRVFGS